MGMSRRDFLRGGALAAAGVALTGRQGEANADAPQMRTKGLKSSTTICPYCAVACGVVIYSKGDLTKGEEAEIIHIEGDVDHPTNRGTLCPKGAALLDFVKSPARLTKPRLRKPGTDRFEDISWEAALDRIARLMKDDRDKNFVVKNASGATVNRWLTTGFLAASASTNETALATWKVVRGSGMLVFDNQARV